MAQAPQFSSINHDDEAINRIQDQVGKVLDPLVASPMNGATLVKNVVLKTGVTVVPHNLGRTPQGFEVARLHTKTAPVDWTALGLQGTWSAQTFGGIFPTPSYRRMADGRVELRGLVQNSAVPAGNSAIALFTTDMSPQDGGSNSGRLWALPTESNTAVRWMQRIDLWAPANNIAQLVYLAGYVYGGAASGASITYISLDNVSWFVPTVPTPNISENLDTQAEDPTKVIRMTSDAACTVDLLFF